MKKGDKSVENTGGNIERYTQCRLQIRCNRIVSLGSDDYIAVQVGVPLIFHEICLVGGEGGEHVHHENVL